MRCEFPSNAGTSAAEAALGIKIPKIVDNAIVDTDNKSYIAMGGCVDGSIYQWSILSTTAKLPKLKAKTLRLLNVSLKELHESATKKVKSGRTEIYKGDCAKAKKEHVGGKAATVVNSMGMFLGGL
jgi:hypothetical protein